MSHDWLGGDNFEIADLDPLEVEVLATLLRRLRYAEWRDRTHAHLDRTRPAGTPEPGGDAAAAGEAPGGAPAGPDVAEELP